MAIESNTNLNLTNFPVRQDRKVLRLLAGRDRPERVDQPVQGDAAEERAGGQAQALRGPAGTDGQAGPLCSLQPAKRLNLINYSSSGPLGQAISDYNN